MLKDLQVIRENRGLKQIELPKLSNVSNRTISDIEYGKKIPRIDTVYLLSIGLSMEAKDLYNLLIRGEEFYKRF